MVETRSFHDDDGVRWEVREINDPTLAIIPARQLRRPEFALGWLLFTSDMGGRRRLAPVPGLWHESSDSELRAWCRQAMDAQPLRPARVEASEVVRHG
jgi:hypothetical protein